MNAYIAVEANYVSDLTHRVNRRISEGYLPVGGPIEAKEYLGDRFVQMMFRQPDTVTPVQDVQTPLTFDQALEVLRKAFNIRFRLMQDIANLKGERQPGTPGERGYADIEAIVTAIEQEADLIAKLRAEKAALLREQQTKSQDISARIRAMAIALGIEVK